MCCGVRTCMLAWRSCYSQLNASPARAHRLQATHVPLVDDVNSKHGLHDYCVFACLRTQRKLIWRAFCGAILCCMYCAVSFAAVPQKTICRSLVCGMLILRQSEE